MHSNKPIIPVSVIIASYNSKRWLADAVQSINTTPQPVEILIIDDCSTDGSDIVAEQLSKQHSNIRVLRTSTNGGAAIARRYGLEKASQELVCFVDSDDLISSGALESAVGKMTANVDICLFDLWRFTSLDTAWRDGSNMDASEVNGNTAFELSLGSWNIHAFGVYRKSLFLAGYEFLTVDSFNADEILTRILFKNARIITRCTGRYMYRLNDESITRGFNPKFPGIMQSHRWLIKNGKTESKIRYRRIVKQAVKDAYRLTKQIHLYQPNWVNKELNEFLRDFDQEDGLSRALYMNPKYHFYLYKIRLHLKKVF